MTDYRAPLDDIGFTLRHVVDSAALAELDGCADIDDDLVDGLLAEAARFIEQIVAPTNRDGDQVGARHNPDGSVTTAPGHAEAYAGLVSAGWTSLGFPADYGGGGLPWVLAIAVQEMLTSANMGLSVCPLLTQGAVEALLHHGSEEQKETFLPKLVSGEWSGTMNLSEPQAGSDVGALTTRAVRDDDGNWRLFGQKIFITYGEHDMADNIVHLVLARTPGSPPGTRGISLFIVPKLLVEPDGSLGEPNDVACVSIEHKLGIHASPTCVMAYGENEGAVGYLVGEERQGMRAMFTMMNAARLAVGLQGVAIAERAYQQALAYAHERLQGRAPGAPAGTSSPIVDHADVQRMLLDMRACIAAARGLCYRTAEAIDWAASAPDAERRSQAAERAALLTPLAKAWPTDLGVELASTALQVHGGMGYVEETGAAQHLRDSRIAPIYEGTNGIQALDLVERKLPMRGGAVVCSHLSGIEATVAALAGFDDLHVVAGQLGAAAEAASAATEWLLDRMSDDRASAQAAAVPYLEMLALATGGQILADGAVAACKAGLDDRVVQERSVLARFFAAHRLSAVAGKLAAVTAGAADLQAARAGVLAQ